MLKVTLPDGKTVEYRQRVRPVDIAAEIGPRLAKATVAANVDGKLVGRANSCRRTANSAFAWSPARTPKRWACCGIRVPM